MLNRLFRRLNVATNSPLWLWSAIFLTAAALGAAALWKYWLCRYDGLDLAIYNQVLWKSVRGELFGLTVHPHSYLGDHAEFLLLALAPLYALWQDARLLLLAQAAALAAGAWFVWKIARARAAKLGADEKWARLAAGLLAAAWLASPVLHSIGLFEFHFLPFALLPLLAAALFYERGRFWPFVVSLGIALLCREDVALVVVAFSALAWLEKKPLAWRVAPLVMGAAWFVAATALVSHFNPDGAYKFAAYYAWLGETSPLAFVRHLASLANLEMLLGFLMATAFLPLLAPRRLVLLALPLAQILLGAAGGGSIVLKTHYATLFLPALFLAATDGLLTLPQRNFWKKFLRERDLAAATVTFVVVCLAWSGLTFGPWPGVVASLFDRPLHARAALARAAADAVPEDAPVAASYSLLPRLSGRDSAYSLHYLFFGVTQFDAATYPVPRGLAYLAVDSDDFLTYRAEANKSAWMSKNFNGGRERLMMLAGETIWDGGPFTIYARREEVLSPWQSAAEEPHLTRRRLSSVYENGEFVINAEWNRPAAADAYTIFVSLYDVRGHLARRFTYPLLGLPPQSVETADGITTRLTVPLDRLEAGEYKLLMEAQRRDEEVILGPLLDTARRGQEISGWTEDWMTVKVAHP